MTVDMAVTSPEVVSLTHVRAVARDALEPDLASRMVLPSRPLHETPGAREEGCQELGGTFRSGNPVAAAGHAGVENHVFRVEIAELREVARPQRALELFHGFLPRAMFARTGMAR